jgi:hypothetical protein
MPSCMYTILVCTRLLFVHGSSKVPSAQLCCYEILHVMRCHIHKSSIDCIFIFYQNTLLLENIHIILLYPSFHIRPVFNLVFLLSLTFSYFLHSSPDSSSRNYSLFHVLSSNTSHLLVNLYLFDMSLLILFVLPHRREYQILSSLTVPHRREYLVRRRPPHVCASHLFVLLTCVCHVCLY